MLMFGCNPSEKSSPSPSGPTAKNEATTSETTKPSVPETAPEATPSNPKEPVVTKKQPIELTPDQKKKIIEIIGNAFNEETKTDFKICELVTVFSYSRKPKVLEM